MPVTFKNSYILSISCHPLMYYICGDFSIHVDVRVGDCYKFMVILDSCDLKQLFNLHLNLSAWSHIGPDSIPQ